MDVYDLEFAEMNDDGNLTNIPGTFMLSNDIKHDNIFIGAEHDDHEYAPGPPFDLYPAARMGDFGLSRLGKIERENRAHKFPPGTRIWRASVSHMHLIPGNMGTPD